MSMATGTAIAVGAAVAGGAQVASSVIGSKAAHDAADVQAASGNKALDLQKSIYDQQQSNLAPYRAIGGVGLSALTNLAGHPAQMAPGGNGWVGLNSLTMPPSSGPGDGAQMPNTMGGAPPSGAPGGTGLASLSNGSEPMVMMESPDGTSRRAVPASQVDSLTKRGAKVIGNGGGGGALPRLGQQVM